jgi:hypothetical protein
MQKKIIFFSIFHKNIQFSIFNTFNSQFCIRFNFDFFVLICYFSV